MERQVSIALNLKTTGAAGVASSIRSSINGKADAGKATGAAGGGPGGIANVLPVNAGGGAGGVLNSITGSIGQLGGMAGKALKALGPVGLAIGAVAIVGKMAADKVMAFAQTMMQFAGLASPATMKRFNLALHDTQAVIGRMFVPVLDLAARGIRLVGDFLASILPTSGQVREALRPLDGVLQELRSSLADVAPIFREFVVVHLKLFAVGVRLAAEQLKLGIQALKFVSGVPLLKQLGLMGQGGLASSTGASGASASFAGIEDIGKSMQLAAFGSGVQDAPSQTASNTARIREILDFQSGILKQVAGAAQAADPTSGVRRAIDWWSGR